MNLMTLLLTGALIAGGLGAHAVLDNQPITNSTTAPSQSINELQAKTTALDTSKGVFLQFTNKKEGLLLIWNKV